jgi:hypothetical protein
MLVKCPERQWQVHIDEETELMEALAEQQENEHPDDGAIKDSGDEFHK